MLNGNNLTFTDTTINYTSTVIRTGSFQYDNTKNVLLNGTWQNVAEDAGQLYSGTFPTMQKVE